MVHRIYFTRQHMHTIANSERCDVCKRLFQASYMDKPSEKWYVIYDESWMDEDVLAHIEHITGRKEGLGMPNGKEYIVMLRYTSYVVHVISGVDSDVRALEIARSREVNRQTIMNNLEREMGKDTVKVIQPNEFGHDPIA